MDLEERIMELSRYGYACGQILGILLLDTIGEENPALIRCPFFLGCEGILRNACSEAPNLLHRALLQISAPRRII